MWAAGTSRLRHITVLIVSKTIKRNTLKNIGLSQSINEIERLTSEAARARDKISSLTMLDQDAEFISLGFNCSTALF